MIDRPVLAQQDVVKSNDFQIQTRRQAPYAHRNAEDGLVEGIYKILYKSATHKSSTGNTKAIEFLGSALHDLRSFPLTARREAGHQLDQVQRGWEPDDFNPMNTMGAGVQPSAIANC